MNEQTQGHPPFLMRCLDIEEWANYVAAYDFGPVPPGRVVLHHTWRPTIEEWQGIDSMRGMQRYYANMGWSAGPHIYVAPDGIWLATPMSEIGVHAGIGNSGWWGGAWSYSIGVEMVGNYDLQRPSGKIWDMTKHVLGRLSIRLGIAPADLIWFHRDFSDKTCPGATVTKRWVIEETDYWINNSGDDVIKELQRQIDILENG